MAQKHASSKRLQIDKANTTILIVTSIACFVTVFSLAASKVLVQQTAYQSKVIAQKTKARDQLEANLKARDDLVTQYKAFVQQPINMIGGTTAGSTDRDGDNAKLILDALPSKYDYPAVATSLEKLLQGSGLTIRSITGDDDELTQAMTGSQSTPVPVEMPFQVGFTGESTKTQDFFTALSRSIRPMHVQTLTIKGTDQALTTDITAKTYYQPEKNLHIKSEVVR